MSPSVHHYRTAGFISFKNCAGYQNLHKYKVLELGNRKCEQYKRQPGIYKTGCNFHYSNQRFNIIDAKFNP
jgi:hypothetical protein